MACAILPVPRKVILEKMLEGVGVVEKEAASDFGRLAVRRRFVRERILLDNMVGSDW